MVDEVNKGDTPDMELFFTIAAVIIGLSVLTSLVDGFRWKIDVRLSVNFIRDLRKELFDKIQMISMRSFARRTSGDIIRRVSDDANALKNFLTGQGKAMILNVVALVTISVIALSVNWRLALLVLVPMPVAAILAQKIMRKINALYGRWWRKVCNSSKYLNDIISGQRVVKSYGSEERETERYADISGQVAYSYSKAECTW